MKNPGLFQAPACELKIFRDICRGRRDCFENSVFMPSRVLKVRGTSLFFAF